MYKKIISKAPGRVCLFGDHQDYLGLPIIATTINNEIKLEATPNNERKFTHATINADELDKPEFIGILLVILISYPMSGLQSKSFRTFKAILKKSFSSESYSKSIGITSVDPRSFLIILNFLSLF
jgi:mevalonate kinase